MDLTWIIAAFVTGLILIVVEMFLPGAVLGFIGFLTVCASIVYAFVTKHTIAGIVMTVVTIMLIPVFFVVWKNVLVHFFALKNDERGFRPSSRISEDLLGEEGTAASPLRPSGIATIQDRRHDVVTLGEMLENGTRIKVIDVSGNRIVVKKV